MRPSAICVALLLTGCTDPPAAVAPRDAAADHVDVADAADVTDHPTAPDVPGDPTRCATPDARRCDGATHLACARGVLTLTTCTGGAV